MCWLALAVLAAGAAVYWLDREAGAWFLPAWLAAAGPDGFGFGAIGGSLPSFCHALAFTVLTAAVLRPWPRALLPACAVLIIVEWLFELGQRDGLFPAAEYVTAGIFRPGFVSRFFSHGTFDPQDMFAVVLGALAGYLLARLPVFAKPRA